MDIRERSAISRHMVADRPLAGQHALVTGANSGIGKAVAIALAEAGAAVAVNYVIGDVDAMFAEACAAFGTLDIVVANAGLQRDAPLEEMTLAQWSTVIGVNLTGQFLCARAAVREFLRRGRRPEVSRALGKIICMSSVHEVIPWAGHANYAASKGGVMMLMKTIAQELAPRGIRVNGLAPGATRTPINTEAWSTPEAYEALMRLVPYKRIGEPEDIACAAVWLASDASDYVNGVTLFVDGGMTLYPEFASGG